MNYKKFRAEWLRLMEVASFYDKVYLEQDINDSYTYFRQQKICKTPKEWIKFFYSDYAEHKHPYYLKSKNK